MGWRGLKRWSSPRAGLVAGRGLFAPGLSDSFRTFVVLLPVTGRRLAAESVADVAGTGGPASPKPKNNPDARSARRAAMHPPARLLSCHSCYHRRSPNSAHVPWREQGAQNI